MWIQIKSYVERKVAKLYKYKGTVETLSELPTSDLVIGDTYNVKQRSSITLTVNDASTVIQADAGDNVVWNGEYWDNLSGFVDLDETLKKYVKFTDYATSSKAGVVKYNIAFGIGINSDGYVYTTAANQNEIDLRTTSRKPIVPSNLDYAVRSVYPITQTALSDPITVNTIYNLGLQTDIVIALPSGQLGDFIQVDFVSGTTATSLTVSSSNGIIGYDLTPEANNIYTLYFDWGVTACDTAGVQTYGWRCNYFEYAITLSQSSSGFEPEVT